MGLLLSAQSLGPQAPRQTSFPGCWRLWGLEVQLRTSVGEPQHLGPTQ